MACVDAAEQHDVFAGEAEAHLLADLIHHAAKDHGGEQEIAHADFQGGFHAGGHGAEHLALDGAVIGDLDEFGTHAQHKIVAAGIGMDLHLGLLHPCDVVGEGQILVGFLHIAGLPGGFLRPLGRLGLLLIVPRVPIADPEAPRGQEAALRVHAGQDAGVLTPEGAALLDPSGNLVPASGIKSDTELYLCVLDLGAGYPTGFSGKLLFEGDIAYVSGGITFDSSNGITLADVAGLQYIIFK